jgi:hypothetical protein
MAANASPLATLVASTATGNRRRAASGRVCSRASAYPRTTTPLASPLRDSSDANRLTLRAAAAAARTLSNTFGLARAGGGRLARSCMPRPYRRRAPATSTRSRHPHVLPGGHPAATTATDRPRSPTRVTRLAQPGHGH